MVGRVYLNLIVLSLNQYFFSVKKTQLLLYFIWLLLSVVLFSCQKEEKEFIDETPEDTIAANSPLTELLLRTAQNPGAYDDLVDGNGCASIILL